MTSQINVFLRSGRGSLTTDACCLRLINIQGLDKHPGADDTITFAKTFWLGMCNGSPIFQMWLETDRERERTKERERQRERQRERERERETEREREREREKERG